MTASYDLDVIAWANEQAALIRTGRFDLLDIEHIANEIEDVGRSERKELKNRMSTLIAHLLKWEYQPDYQGNSWRKTINVQRKDIAKCIKEMPSLKSDLQDEDWQESVWANALTIATHETGFRYDRFPENNPWSIEQILNPEFWPEA